MKRIISIFAALLIIGAACGEDRGGQVTTTTTSYVDDHQHEHGEDHDHDHDHLEDGDVIGPLKIAAWRDTVDDVDPVAAAAPTNGQVRELIVAACGLAEASGGDVDLLVALVLEANDDSLADDTAIAMVGAAVGVHCPEKVPSL